jgi:D-glycero-alpha-D-manno-heptose 1-phosphate guanylyltransferase
MQAIVLAGGFGTRLRSVIADVPKPMAPIHGKPFLAYLLDYLKSQGITEVVLSVHYLKEQIQAYFQNTYNDMTIHYAVEEQPLGTGGAIVNSLKYVDNSKPVFVLNGDTFLKINYELMMQQHLATKPCMTMALRQIADCSRYGVVLTEGTAVTAFNEKGHSGEGLINAGVYLLDAALLSKWQGAEAFSFERDFLFPQISYLRPQAFITDHYFIDIGVPEDYARAVAEFS